MELYKECELELVENRGWGFGFAVDDLNAGSGRGPGKSETAGIFKGCGIDPFGRDGCSVKTNPLETRSAGNSSATSSEFSIGGAREGLGSEELESSSQ